MTITTAGDLDVVRRLLADQPSFHKGGDAHWNSLPQTLEAINRAVKPGDTTIETGAGGEYRRLCSRRRASHRNQPGPGGA